MACVTSTSFSLNINDNIHGFFKGKRGLRQGDPLSPYIFTMVIEVLSLILKRRVRVSDSFRFHKHCEELEIINVCFVDDLFIFARGDLASARVILDSLDEFKMVLGLVPSIPKRELPVNYLGVPFISSRLLNKDCKILVEKAKNRIGDWKNKSLSFTGRLQLCKSVISSMHVYWASILMIPKGIIYDIHQLVRGFLWCNGEYKRGKAKVAWDDICLPKEEGGLDVFNIALMTTYIWNIVSNKESLWVRWIHTYKLRGNGTNTSIWFDNWCSLSPLNHFLTPIDISREGFSISTSVAELVTNGSWSLASSFNLAPKASVLADFRTVLDLSRADVRQWRDNNGSFSVFSVAKAWETL
ncbi:hypothetical protein Tco_0807083 [Tanacetum coccineum]